jgi:glutamyl-tRNA synthetase
MSSTVRFAPSPTGYLHAGAARAAILNALFAIKEGGAFLLRIDDTDDTRSKPEFERAIVEDLVWLGVSYELFARQSERVALYEEAVARLKASGHLYPAYETAAELDRRRKRQIAARRPPIYDRTALALDDGERARLESEGRKPHWRFKLSHKKIVWNDLVRGTVEIDTSTLSDPVLVREDGRFLYMLPSVVDDADFKITHVIRGEDHVTNTATQIEIFEALGASVPQFAHYPLFLSSDDEKLSKREGSLSLRTLREDGIEALALASYVAKIGTSDAIEPRTSLEALAGEFAFGKIARAPAHFDLHELATLNAKLLHELGYDAVASRLTAMGVGGGPAFWEAARPNIAKLADTTRLWCLVDGPVTPVIENAAVVSEALALLPPEPWSEATWTEWTKKISEKSGANGRALFYPLRLALTGTDHGPELKKLLPLIGREKAEARLKGKTA